jgi:hypothetical protein
MGSLDRQLRQLGYRAFVTKMKTSLTPIPEASQRGCEDRRSGTAAQKNCDIIPRASIEKKSKNNRLKA